MFKSWTRIEMEKQLEMTWKSSSFVIFLTQTVQPDINVIQLSTSLERDVFLWKIFEQYFLQFYKLQEQVILINCKDYRSTNIFHIVTPYHLSYSHQFEISFTKMEGTSAKVVQQAPIQLKPKINPELAKKYRQIFDSFDKQQDGYVQAKDVPGVLRILGVSMSEQEVVDSLGDRAIKSDNPLISTKIDFADFLALVVDKESEMTMKQELMESFKVFDTDKTGSILVSELRYYLRAYGVAMSEQQVEDLLKDSQPEDGYVKYEKFIDKMLDKS